jgi:hypothetical protein
MGSRRFRAAAAALTAALLLFVVAVIGAAGETEQAIRVIEAADRLAVGSLEEFEHGGGISEARRTLASAREARNLLEAAKVSPRFSEARREELAFLNHLVGGFEAYLAAPDTDGALRNLQGIVTRGRRHRELARAALEKAKG